MSDPAPDVRAGEVCRLSSGGARVGVAHPGTQHSWQTARAFQDVGRLAWYATNGYYKATAWPDRLIEFLPTALSRSLQQELRRRRYDGLDDELVRRHFALEPLERALRPRSVHAAEWFTTLRHRVFPRRLIRLMRREPVDFLWGPYDCLEAFEWAKPKGVFCILDQPNVHYCALDAIMRAERRTNPDFFVSVLHDVRPEQISRQQRAAEIADMIVVGSAFARQSMLDEGVPDAKVVIAPYGYDESAFSDDAPIREPLRGRPLEMLFVGSLGPRKGLAYLLEAFASIPPSYARLTLVGPLDAPPGKLAGHGPQVRYLGQARRREVAEHMRQADCFILPSLAEGGGIVLYEAAAAGLALVQSAQCGDGVREGRNGIILEEVSADCIRKAVMDLATSPDRLAQMQGAAWSMRKERSWSVYRQHVATLLDQSYLTSNMPAEP